MWFFRKRKKAESKPVEKRMKRIGYAILRKDDITGLKLWATFDEEGKAHINLSPEQPLIFPTHGKMQIGTQIDWLVPEE